MQANDNGTVTLSAEEAQHLANLVDAQLDNVHHGKGECTGAELAVAEAFAWTAAEVQARLDAQRRQRTAALDAQVRASNGGFGFAESLDAFLARGRRLGWADVRAALAEVAQ